VSRDADEPDESFLPRLDSRLERSSSSQSGFPLDHVDEVVQLDQVEVVDAEALQRALDLLLRAGVVPPSGLRREEEATRLSLQPRGYSQLRVAVGGGRVDVVDAVLEQELERSLSLGM
jgi:hypothetical protein